MKKNNKTHRISLKLSEEYYERFQVISKGHGYSDTVRALIDGGYYFNRPGLAAACVQLMNAVSDVKGQCDMETYRRLEEGGKEICRLLSTRQAGTEMKEH